jgi:alginate O-acetyltransferase complex protein AlgI
MNTEVMITFIAAIVFAFNLFGFLGSKLTSKPVLLLKYTLMLTGFVYGIIAMSAGSYNPFIYFRF